MTVRRRPTMLARALTTAAVSGLFVLAMRLLSGCAAVPPAASPAPPRVPIPAAARRLPVETAALVWSDDPRALAKTIGHAAIERAMLAEREELAYELVRATGFDLLGLSDLQSIGIDPSAPAGAGWVLAPRPTWVLFVTLSDPRRFKSALYRAGSRDEGRLAGLRPEVVGETVVAANDELAVVIDGSLAIAVAGDDAARLGRALARLAPGERLADAPAFRRAVERISPQAALRGFVDGRAWLYAEKGMDPRWRGSSHARAAAALEAAQREALAAARRRRVSAAELVAIDARFGRARRALRDDRDSRRMRWLAGGIESAALSAEVHARGAEVRVEVALDDDCWLRRLFRPKREPIATLVPAARRAPPALLASLSVDPEELWTAAKVLGLDRSIAALLEVDVPKDVLGALDGELALGWWAAGGSEPRKAPLAAVAGVRDPAALDRLLLRFAKGALRGALSRAADGSWQLALRAGPTLRARMRAGRLVAASDPRLLARSEQALPLEGPAALLSRPAGAAASVAPGMWLVDSLHVDLLAPPAAPLELAQASDTYRQKRLALAALDERIAERRARHRARARDRHRRLAERMGTAALRLGNTPEGLSIELRFATRDASIEKLAGEWLALRRDPGPSEEELASRDRELGSWLEQRRALDDELFELEQQGADRR